MEWNLRSPCATKQNIKWLLLWQLSLMLSELQNHQQDMVTQHQLTSNKSSGWWIGIRMLRCTCALIQVQVQNKSKHRKENSMWHTCTGTRIMLSARHPSTSLSFHHNHLVSVSLITLLFSLLTHSSVICGHPGGSSPVSPGSSRLNKVMCANWQTGLVLSLPLTERMSPNTWIRHLWTQIWCRT